MKNFDEIVNKIEEKLNEKDDLREKTLKKCRDIIRESRRSIKSVHSGDMENARKYFERARDILKEIKEELKEHPDILTAGYMENAMQEVAESAIFLAIVEEENLPLPDELAVSYTSYLMGMADVVGELRRRGVYTLKNGKIEEVEEILEMMEEICDKMMEFDYPSGLIPIKRKQDVIKKILEKMRGEVAILKKSKELESKIEAIIQKLKKKEEKGAMDIDSLL
ncbi:MAG TPA: RNA-binding protein [Thermoplasmata archaeon]|nr:RNA-binding protein [Thermoplasmata archaeon]